MCGPLIDADAYERVQRYRSHRARGRRRVDRAQRRPRRRVVRRTVDGRRATTRAHAWRPTRSSARCSRWCAPTTSTMRSRSPTTPTTRSPPGSSRARRRGSPRRRAGSGPGTSTSTGVSPAHSSGASPSAGSGCRASAPRPAAPTTSCSSSSPASSPRTPPGRASHRLRSIRLRSIRLRSIRLDRSAIDDDLGLVGSPRNRTTSAASARSALTTAGAHRLERLQRQRRTAQTPGCHDATLHQRARPEQSVVGDDSLVGADERFARHPPEEQRVERAEQPRFREPGRRVTVDEIDETVGSFDDLVGDATESDARHRPG